MRAWYFGRTQPGFLANGVSSLARSRVFGRNGENGECTFCLQKQGLCSLGPLKTMKMTKLAVFCSPNYLCYYGEGGEKVEFVVSSGLENDLWLCSSVGAFLLAMPCVSCVVHYVADDMCVPESLLGHQYRLPQSLLSPLTYCLSICIPKPFVLDIGIAIFTNYCFGGCNLEFRA